MAIEFDTSSSSNLGTSLNPNPVTILDLLGYLVDGARNAGISDGSEDADGDVYLLTEKLRAINGILNHFARETGAARQTDYVDIFQNVEDVDLSDIVGFEPSRVKDAAILSERFLTAVLSAGAVGSVIVNYSLTYTSAPTVTFSGNGTGAAATATLTNGKVTAIVVTAGGSGYSAPPTVYLNGVATNYSDRDVRLGVSFAESGELRIQRSLWSGEPGTPRLVEITDGTAAAATAGKVFPIPQADGRLRILWSPLLGSLTEEDVVPMPADMAITAVRTGGVCWLQNGTIENTPITNVLYQQYLSHVASNKGRTGVAKSFVRSVPRRPNGPSWPEIVRIPNR